MYKYYSRPVNRFFIRRMFMCKGRGARINQNLGNNSTLDKFNPTISPFTSRSLQDDELGQTTVRLFSRAGENNVNTESHRRLANVAGTQEPIYGSSAVHSVAEQAKTTTTPFTELGRGDLRWAAMDTTCVETQVFYLMSDSGHVGMAQVIYSNVA